MDNEQIERVLDKDYKTEYDGDFEKCLASFVDLDYSIDLVNEVGKASTAVSRQFKLNKEKADENIDDETGQARYYTTKQFCYGTWVVGTWRKYNQDRIDFKAANYGEVVNGRRKIKEAKAFERHVSNIPYDFTKPTL